MRNARLCLATFSNHISEQFVYKCDPKGSQARLFFEAYFAGGNLRILDCPQLALGNS
jgi:hypothetical protein